MNDEIYLKFKDFIALLKTGHRLLNSTNRDTLCTLYSTITNHPCCSRCNEDISKALNIVLIEINNYESSKSKI